MSLSDRKARSGTGLAAAWVIATAMLAIGGCTVRPLYGDAGPAGGQGASAALASVEVKPVSTRQALEVRNHLIFLLSGGAGQPAAPAYALDLTVTSTTVNAATVQIATDNEPSAGSVTVKAAYRLTDADSGDVVSSGERSSTASFDRLRQEFASLRAERDAENRAARELAELLKLAIVHDLEMRAGQ